MKVPFNDLHLQYQTIKEELDSAIESVIASSAFIRGPFVDRFEKNFSSLMGVDKCISCANGTDALYIAMRALGVKPGDEVIVPAHSWISTSETVSQAGAKVVFCDTEKTTYTIDVNQIEEKITDKTVGIIPVHLFGQAADMGAIMEIAKKYNLWVIEDCAQAHLAKYEGQLVGSFGDASTFSFYPGKNLGAMGDAGGILTNSEDLATKMAMIARHGGLQKGQHVVEGINSRLDGIQAAILDVKLKYLQEWTTKRQFIAAQYCELLSGISELSLPEIGDGRDHVWHLFVINTKERNFLQHHLKKNGIDTVVNYPVSLPFLEAYEYLGHSQSDFPVAFESQSRILSLPIFPDITNQQIEYVCECIKNFFASNIRDL